MIPYDEGQVGAFIDDATAIYQQAHRSPDPHALIWVARMQFDAETMGYAASRAKHLNELRAALGLPLGPVVPVPDGPPPNIRTTDRAEVRKRVEYWLGTIGHNTDVYVKLWMDYIFDVAGEGHDVGWTADEPNNYWTVKILTGDYD